ncbi:hypothetical protein MMC25_001531 [Agyrium rufum]|nr:hypothetical protein [Agyrium rufum]
MTQKEVAKANDRDLVDQKMRELADAQNSVTTVPTKQERKAQKSQKATAGSSWFDLPKTNLTPELKRDLQILGMRSVLDPKRHYKKENGKIRPPEFSQVGTIIEGPTEYYSGRLLNRERRKNLVEDILAGEATTGRFKRKYEDIQKTKTSGKKAHYKALKEKRRSTRV